MITIQATRWLNKDENKIGVRDFYINPNRILWIDVKERKIVMVSGDRFVITPDSFEEIKPAIGIRK